MNIGVRVLELGFLILLGGVSGKCFCGKVCPFGLFQGLLYKIPFPLKANTFKAHKYLRYLKYALLALMVLLLFIFPMEEPARASQVLDKKMVLVLAAFILLCIMIYRPFCKYLCPGEAILTVGNLIPFYRYKVDEQKCSRCGMCAKACKMNLQPYETSNHMDCNHCGACKKACRTKAISSGFSFSG
nr:4Fe-4S binding protein [Desulfosporosinus fructosivorans]